MFQKFYHTDPMEMSYDRFITMFAKMNKIEANFRGKSELEQALELREAELEEERMEDAKEQGLDLSNPLVDAVLDVKETE